MFQHRTSNPVVSIIDNIQAKVDDNIKKLTQLITTLKIEEVQPLLNLYSMKDNKAASKLESSLQEISQIRKYYISLTQQLNWVKSKLTVINIKKSLLKSMDLKIDHTLTQITLSQYDLNIAEYYCQTYLNRLEKKYRSAAIIVDKWIAEIDSYKKYLSKYQLYIPQNLFNAYLVNAYNHKAKIHRALAGTNLQNLDKAQLNLAFDSYQNALKISNNKSILNCIGFLCNDMAINFLDKRKDFHNLSLQYHKQAFELDNQDPHIYHGLGWALYNCESYHHECNLEVKHDNLQQALTYLTYAQQKNPSARLFLDKGLIYLLFGDCENALKNFNSGLIMEPNHILLRYHRGKLYFKKGHIVSALEDLNYGRILATDSENMKIIFDDAIKTTSVQLSNEYKFAEISKNNLLDIRAIAKQDAFESSLRACAKYGMTLQKKPSIFISYAWPTPGHQNYEKQVVHLQTVMRLAKELEIAGIRVRLDIWEDKKGNNMSEFIETILDDYVLVIGTHLYLEKCKFITQDNTRDPVIKFENYLLSYLMRYTENSRQKIIPLILEGTAEECLPPILLPKTPVDFVKCDRFDETFKLIRTVYQLPIRDDTFSKIVDDFNFVAKGIDKSNSKFISKQHGSSMYTLFQNNVYNIRKANELIENNQKLLTSKL